jgi:hypothetical protein
MTLFLLQDEGGREGGVVAKCLLMANGPLPDFKVRWADGAVLRYSLRTGHLSLSLGEALPLALPPSLPRKHEWNVEGGGSCWVLQGGREGGREGGRMGAYLSQAQGAMRRCLEMGERWEGGRAGGKEGRVVYESAAAAAAEAAVEARRWREKFSLSLVGRKGREGGKEGGKEEEKRATKGGTSSGNANGAGAASKKSNSSYSSNHPSSKTSTRHPSTSSKAATTTTTTTTTTTSSSSSSSSSSTTSNINKGEDHHHVLLKALPGLGKATRGREGGIEVRFEGDGSLLALSADGSKVRYCEGGEGGREGGCYSLLPSQGGEGKKEKLPREVKRKLRIVLTQFLA